MENPEEVQVGPAVEEKVEEKKRTQQARRTVLLVEDDPANREVLEEMLGGWGYEVVAVGSAEEAEYAVKRRRPDAAVVDVFLPGRSGTALMARLREKFPEAVLIGTSALSDAAMSRECKGLGADLFIGKPIDMDKLAKALQSRHVSWH
jgi:CheY-like chemotaxis protein